MAGVNYLDMSDEDFMKAHAEGFSAGDEPPVVEAPVEPVVTEPVPVQEETPVVVEPPVVEEPKVVEPPVEVPATPDGNEPPVVVDPKAEPAKEGTAPAATEPKVEEPAPVDYQKLYTQITAPIKANGREIEIKSPEDAIRLMQMGLGFNKKMQEIGPHLKTLRLLKQNDLLDVDQSELAFLIDLRNKNPDAIKKLVKDAGIDPLDINNDEPVNYRSNVAPVTDQQVAYGEALDTLKDVDGGTETISIMGKWDTQSHVALYNNPTLLQTIHEQRQLGIYDKIAAEVDREKALGHIQQTTPFLEAYRLVGDRLNKEGAFANLQPAPAPVVTPPAAVAPQLLETRAVQPKSPVANSAQAAAAASSKNAPKKVQQKVNILGMSDEEFMKQYGQKFG